MVLFYHQKEKKGIRTTKELRTSLTIPQAIHYRKSCVRELVTVNAIAYVSISSTNSPYTSGKEIRLYLYRNIRFVSFSLRYESLWVRLSAILSALQVLITQKEPYPLFGIRFLDTAYSVHQ